VVGNARAALLSVQLFRTGRSDSARQRLVKPAEHRIGHDLRFPFLQPSPVFCPCRLHLGPLDCPGRPEEPHLRLEFGPEPIELFGFSSPFQISTTTHPFPPRALSSRGLASQCSQAASPIPQPDGILALGVGGRDVGPAVPASDAVKQGIETRPDHMGRSCAEWTAADRIGEIVYKVVCAWTHDVHTGARRDSTPAS